MSLKHTSKTKFITPSQWAESHNSRRGKPYTLAGVTKMIRAGKYLEDVFSIKNAGRFYLLEVADDLTV